MKFHGAILAAALALAAADAAAQGVKVGVVNLARIEAQSAVAKRAAESLKTEFEPRNRQIQELQKKIAAGRGRLKKEGDKMPAAERQALERELSGMMRQSDQMVLAMRDDYELRRKELGAKVVEDARAAIHAVAEAGKYDLILQEAAFVRPSVDITDLVLKEMAKRGGSR
jgi:outer membrane protein